MTTSRLRPRVRRIPEVRAEVGEQELSFPSGDGAKTRCRVLAEDFPDRRSLFTSLPAVTRRLTLETTQILTALQQEPEKFGLRIAVGTPELLLTDAAMSLNGTEMGTDAPSGSS